MPKSRMGGYRKYVKWDTILAILLIKKEYLCELMKECLHMMDRECDLVGEVEKVKKLEKSKEM